MPNSPFDTRNGWRLFTHPAFKTVYDGLVADVDRLAVENPTGYTNHPKTKLLARINTLILEEIPADPSHKDYRQGTTLGDQYKNWFRAQASPHFPASHSPRWCRSLAQQRQSCRAR